MGATETITAVIETLKSLFANGGELKGFNDWDALIGCVVALEQVKQDLQKETFQNDMERFKQDEGEIITQGE